MEEGSKQKKTVFIGGLSDEVDEGVLLETFATFGEFPLPRIFRNCLSLTKYIVPGDVIEVQIPPATTDPNRQAGIHVCF